MNYKTVKQQIHQIVIGEVAKYYQKAITPNGLSKDELQCLKLLQELCEFEQNMIVPSNDNTEDPTAGMSNEELLKYLKAADDKPETN